MADFGADVIKIEPPGGDTYRTRGPGYPPSPYNFPWIVDNRSKRGLALDLRTADGQRVLHRLVRDADVFVTNAPLDSRGRLGVRWEDLAPLNPRLIYGSITAYGETGEEASRPGFDATALVGAHRPDGSGAAVAGRTAVALAARHGRSPHRDVDVRRAHGRALPARADGPRHDGLDVAPGQRALAQRHPGAGHPLRRAHGGAAAARGGGRRARPTSIAAATGAGSCCRSPPTGAAGRTSPRPSAARSSSPIRASRRPRAAAPTCAR